LIIKINGLDKLDALAPRYQLSLSQENLQGWIYW